jgi:hypothetical protein
MVNLDHYEHVGIVQNESKTEWVLYAKVRGFDSTESRKTEEIAILAVCDSREDAVSRLDEISRAPGIYDPSASRTSGLSHHHPTN